MKKLLAILAVLILTASFAFAQNGVWTGGNCTATATGHFTFTVEPKIAITVGGDIDLGGICPGCFKDYTQSTNHCLLWTITGGKDCKFNATMTPTSNVSDGTVIIANGWAYGTDNANWTTFTWPYSTYFTFSQPTSGYAGTAYFRDCINRIDVDCFVTPGLYTITHTVEVDYTCPGGKS